MIGSHTALPLISASQIKLFDECERKWAFKYIAKIEDEYGAAAALGTEVDETQLQPYLRDNRPFDFTRESGYIAAAALEYLPQPQAPGLEVQKHFIMPSPSFRDGQHVGFAYQGFMDLWLPDGQYMPEVGEAGIPVVSDFKTTSDIARWALSEDALRTNVQAQLYATAALWATRAAAVDLVWIYLQTRGAKKHKRVHVRVDAEHVADQFVQLDNTAIRMAGIRTSSLDHADPEQFALLLKPNPEACEMYRGCPHRHRCNLSPAAWFESQEAKDQTNMPTTAELLAKLKNKQAGAPVTITTPPPAPPPAQTGPINPPESASPPPAETQPTPPTETAAPKPRRGRPPSPPKDPTGADAHAATVPGSTPAYDAHMDALASAVADKIIARLIAAFGAK